uniref:MADF domain-containing protein n=1 Tax=Daphnia galeata TaxID=27404 RepID=A0A8J2WCE5_9CRUS|nr:unnamed protein product [Daphnia galeata]
MSKKWKQLKDTYRDEKKRLSEEDPSGSGLEGSKRAKKRWTYYDQMGFLSKVYDAAERTTNLDGDEDEEGTHDEYLHEQGNTPMKNWRMREIFESGNFYPSSSDSHNHEKDDTTSSLIDFETASDFSDDHSSNKEMEPVASGSCNKETIEGLKEPDFKIPISPTPSRTPPRKTKGKKASVEGEAAKQIGQLMKTIGKVLESKPEDKKPKPSRANPQPH